jgi:general secretion pathway protein I
LSRSRLPRGSRGVFGFTLLEVLVALAVVAVSLAAIGSLVAATVRGSRSIEEHLALIATARAVIVGMPNRNTLSVGSLGGELNGHRWRIDVAPLRTDAADARPPTPWMPYTVAIEVRSPTGSMLRLNTVRLRRRSGL